jgi:hypothetical protein
VYLPAPLAVGKVSSCNSFIGRGGGRRETLVVPNLSAQAPWEALVDKIMSEGHIIWIVRKHKDSLLLWELCTVYHFPFKYIKSRLIA